MRLKMAIAMLAAAGFAAAGVVSADGEKTPPGGKCVADGGKASLARRLLNRVTRPIATDITRRLDDIIRDSGTRIERTGSEAALGGRFTITRLAIPAA